MKNIDGWRAGALALVAVVAIAVCFAGGVAGDLRIVSLYDTDFNADAWNRRHELARSAAVAQLLHEGENVTSAVEQGVPASRIADRYAYYNSIGTDIIISTNFAHRQAFLNFIATPQGSQQHFITGAALGAPNNNTFSIYGDVYAGTYLAGKACGLTTRTNSVGIVAIIGARGGNAQINAFTMGVKSVNPSATVHMMQAMTSVNSSVVERYIALDMIDNYRVDCLLGGPTTPGAYSAVKMRPNVTMIGLYEDLRYSYGENILFSILYDWKSLYLQGIRGYMQNNFPGKRVVWGPLGSTVVLSDFSTRATPGVYQTLKKAENNIISGTECMFPWTAVSFMYPETALANTVTIIVGKDSNGNNVTMQCLSASQIQSMPTYMLASLGGLIVNPRNWTVNDTITQQYVAFSHPAGVAFSTLATVGLFFCVLLVVFVLRYRERSVIRATTPEFMLVIIGGCALMYCSIYTWFDIPTTAVCNLRIWLFFVGFGLTMSALLVKNFRIWRIFANESMEIFGISSRQLFLFGIVPALTIQLILLILWTSLNTYHVEIDHSTPNLPDDRVNLRCISNNLWSLILTLLYNIVMLVATVMISVLTRNLKYNLYRESRQIAFTCYNIAIMSIACIIVILSVAYTVEVEAIIFCLTIFVISSGVLVFIFVERVKIVLVDDRSGFEQSSSTSTGMTNMRSSAAANNGSGRSHHNSNK